MYLGTGSRGWRTGSSTSLPPPPDTGSASAPRGPVHSGEGFPERRSQAPKFTEARLDFPEPCVERLRFVDEAQIVQRWTDPPVQRRSANEDRESEGGSMAQFVWLVLACAVAASGTVLTIPVLVIAMADYSRGIRYPTARRMASGSGSGSFLRRPSCCGADGRPSSAVGARW
jgi:hypothetical protein